MNPITVFIVDDHFMVIEGIQAMLQNENDLQVVGHASNAASCISFLKQQQPDVLLMDINLGTESGIELCKEVKTMYPQIMILALSTFNQFSFIDKMMENGASGYLLKNAERTEITEAIHHVLKGGTYLSREVTDTMKAVEEGKKDKPALTRREKEILELVADGLTNQEIADQLFIGVSTVDTHRKNLLAKFNVKNTASLIRMAAKLQMI
ncbi:MAG: response regulator transcription factor [Chitinophagaceae bacterium]|nr:response regulator transcription factor [Chitinophagaceae bacterium]